MKVYIKIINSIPQVGGKYITPAGEALNEDRMNEALSGAHSFFSLYGHNAGPYCLVSKTFKKGFTAPLIKIVLSSSSSKTICLLTESRVKN